MYADYSGNKPVTLAFVMVSSAIIGAIIGGVVYVGISLYNGTAITWGGLAKSIIVGAASGVASMGIGVVAQSVTTSIFGTTAGTSLNWALLAVTKGTMHGLAQGFIQGISGGNAGQSFITAMATSIAGDAFGAIGGKADTIVGHSLFGAVIGGAVSNMQGGNFWEGAAIGLTVGILNHAGKPLSKAIDKLLTLNRINNALVAMGLEPTSVAEISNNEQLREFINKMFANSLERTGTAFGVYLVNDITDLKGNSAYGLTVPTADGKNVTRIDISKSALSSWRLLASTVGHELNHVFHFVSGAYNNWVRKYGELGAEYAFARSEYIAQRWEVRNGGLPSLSILNDNYNLMISIENPVRIKR